LHSSLFSFAFLYTFKVIYYHFIVILLSYNIEVPWL